MTRDFVDGPAAAKFVEDTMRAIKTLERITAATKILNLGVESIFDIAEVDADLLPEITAAVASAQEAADALMRAASFVGTRVDVGSKQFFHDTKP